MAQERLQKILAAAGIASRRKAEELITAGHVSVNGETVTQLGTKADGRTDEIRVDGQLLRGREPHIYIMLYKPKGYVTTVSDPEGRPTVMDLLTGIKERVFPVGRLDYASEGLLLLTNDGELMQQLTSAASHVPKSYMVKVSGTPSEEQIERLRSGLFLPPEHTRAGTMGGTREGAPRRSEGVRTQPARIELVRERDNPWYEVTLTEGRNRQIRRMFEQIDHHVEKIRRVRYGPLELDLEPGKWRLLRSREIEALRDPESASAMPRKRPARPVRREESAGAEGRRPAAPRFAAERRRPTGERPAFPKRPKFAGAEDRGPERKKFSRPTEGGFERKPFAPKTRESGFERKPFERKPKEEGFERKKFAGREERPAKRGDSAAGQWRGARDKAGAPFGRARQEGERRFSPGTGERGPGARERTGDRGRGPGERKPFAREGRPFAERGPKREGRPFGEAAPKRESRPFGERGSKREGRPFGEAGPKRESRPFGERGPKREGRPFGERGPKRGGPFPPGKQKPFGKSPGRGERGPSRPPKGRS